MGMVAYEGVINLLAGGSASQPPELESGTYGFFVQARDTNCLTVDEVCDEYELPLDQELITSTLDGEGGGGGGCPMSSTCDNGSCIPNIPDGGVDAFIPCSAGEGAACDDGMGGPTGTCHGGSCCLGCWDGSSCQVGSTPSACGASGAECNVCDPGDSCQGTACVATSTSPEFDLSPRSNFYRHSNGVYWANSDGNFSTSGPVGSTAQALNGYTGDLRFVDIAAAEVATAGVNDEGNLYTWGTNSVGILGSGSSDFEAIVTEPTQIATLDKFRQVAAGAAHFCAIHMNGSLWCWGTGVDGRLGTGGTTFQGSPTRIGTQTWISVASYYEHSCAIRADRTLWCWGKGEDGRLGDGSMSTQSSPVQVGTAADWVQVSPGVGHTCGIRATSGGRRLYCWGRSTSGVLGIGTPMEMTYPEPVEVRDDLVGWQQVAAGEYHTCALIDRGSGVEAFCWGFNGFGELGTSTGDGLTPEPVDLMGGNAGWTTITAGHAQTCGIASGTPYCWGDSRTMPMDNSWLGVGMTDVVPAPAEVVFDPTLP
jgi:alpha-tubulin suppressor-like RCC1 family protein